VFRIPYVAPPRLVAIPLLIQSETPLLTPQFYLRRNQELLVNLPSQYQNIYQGRAEQICTEPCCGAARERQQYVQHRYLPLSSQATEAYLLKCFGDHHPSDFLLSAVVVSAVVIVARFIWNYPAAYLPRRLNFWIRRKDATPLWQWVFTVSFTGIRGIVSLAAALSLPLTTVGGQPSPIAILS
jgi:hypothetical protein